MNDREKMKELLKNKEIFFYASTHNEITTCLQECVHAIIKLYGDNTALTCLIDKIIDYSEQIRDLEASMIKLGVEEDLILDLALAAGLELERRNKQKRALVS